MVDGESARRSVVESWISKARANLRAAETLLGGAELEGDEYDIVGFHAQQATELAI